MEGARWVLEVAYAGRRATQPWPWARVGGDDPPPPFATATPSPEQQSAVTPTVFRKAWNRVVWRFPFLVALEYQVFSVVWPR